MIIVGYFFNYLKGYDFNKIFIGYGIKVFEGDGEDLDSFY